MPFDYLQKVDSTPETNPWAEQVGILIEKREHKGGAIFPIKAQPYYPGNVTID